MNEDNPLLDAEPIELVEVDEPAYPSGEMQHEPGDDHHDVADIMTDDVYVTEE